MFAMTEYTTKALRISLLPGTAEAYLPRVQTFLTQQALPFKTYYVSDEKSTNRVNVVVNSDILLREVWEFINSVETDAMYESVETKFRDKEYHYCYHICSLGKKTTTTTTTTTF